MVVPSPEGIFFPGLLMAILAAWLWKLIHDYAMILEFTDTLPLARAMAGQFVVAPGSILSVIFPQVDGALPFLMAQTSKLGISLETIQLALVHISMWPGFAGIYAATRRLSNRHWASLLASILVTGTG